jgi:gliding motility-associated-like protein
MADHVVGSDILYKCLGNGKYEIIFKFYRDCNGCNVAGGGGGGTGASCPHPVLNITGAIGSCNNQALGTVNITRQSITDITPLCGSTKSKCASGTFPYGIEEHLYTGVIDLSAKIAQGCCKFKISTTIYVRSTTISTGAANAGFYTDATINACDSICNNSPEYTSYPVAIICAGQDFVFNNGAIDTIDVGDSLSYALAPAYQGAGQQVSYSGTFSPTAPMSYLGAPYTGLPTPAGFHLDSLTGDLSFRPTKVNETGVIVIEVTEWRRINGQMTAIGVTRRDMQVIVVKCDNNKIPVIKPPFSAQACAGTQICMSIETYDPDSTTDTVKIAWNKGIPRAVFTNNNGAVKFASGQVCWTPTENDVSTVPYTFTITAKDNACPLSGVTVRGFSIYVRESPKATRTLKELTCGMVAYNAVPYKSYPGGIEVEVRVRDSLDQNYYIGSKLKDTMQLKPGRNIVTLTLKTKTPCVNAFPDTIYIAPYVQVSLPKDTFLCAGSSIPLNAVTTLGKPAYHYKWSTSASDTLTSLIVKPTTDTVYRITVNDGEGCSNTDSIHILYKLRPYIKLDTGARICNNDIVTLDPGHDSVPSTYTYLWNTSATTRKITIKDSNSYIATVKDSIGCTNKDTFNLYVNIVPVNIGPDRSICNGDTLKLSATGANTYKWYKLPNAPVISTYPFYTEVITTPVSYSVHGTLTHMGLTCENDDTINIDVDPLPTINFAAIKDKCEKSAPFNLVDGLAFPTIVSGVWTCIDDPDWVQNNVFYPDSVTVTGSSGFKTIGLVYKVTDNNGCKSSGTTTFRVIQLPKVNVKDTAVCGDKGRIDLRSVVLPPTLTAPGSWLWSSANPSADAAIENNGTTALFNLANVSQNSTYNLCLKVTDLFGCVNTSCSNITSKLVPTVEAGYLPAKCANDIAFQLSQATPAGGTWQSPTGGIVSGNWFNPTIVSTQTHTLYYTYDIPGNNCPVTDSVTVLVNPVPVLSFTPNSNYCSDLGTINLNNFVSPIGGIWSGVGVSSGGSFNATQNTGPQTVFYKYTDGAGCKDSLSGSFTVDAKPTVSILSSSSTCEGEDITLNADFANSPGLQWTSAGNGVFSNPNATTTTYTPGSSDKQCIDFKVETFANGACNPVAANINICVYPIPTATFTADPLFGCEPLPVNFEAITDLKTGALYEWNFGDGGSSENRLPTYIFNSNGSFSVTVKVTTPNNCFKVSDPQIIRVDPVPVAAIDASNWITTLLQNKIQFYDRTTIDAPDNVTSYLWGFGDPDSSFSTEVNPMFEYPTDSGNYWVSLKVISNHGCESQIGRQLLVLPQLTVYIPNAFVPNLTGDIRNERFYVTADGYSAFSISIFSRWGELLYTSDKIEEGWDGKYKGQNVQEDVYVYSVIVTDKLGETFKYNGTITLLR